MPDQFAVTSGDPVQELIVDLTLGTVIATVPISGTAGIPAVTPDNKFAYVPILGGGTGNTVVPIDLSTFTAGTPITVGTEPREVAITPNGTLGYTANDAGGSSTPFTIPGNVPGANITTGPNPKQIAIIPAGTKAYTANFGSNTVTPINIPANTTDPDITGLVNATPIAITPDGTTAYVGDFAGNQVYPITLAGPTVGSPITGTGSSNYISILPNQTTMYVSDSANQKLWPIAIPVGTVGTALNFPAQVLGTAVNSTGTLLYVCTSDNRITTVDVATFTVTTFMNTSTAGLAIALYHIPTKPPFPGSQFIPKLFIPIKGKISMAYTDDELMTNWETIERWAQQWVPPAPVTLFFPAKRTETSDKVDANWITFEVWVNMVRHLGAPYPPLLIPRKSSLNPTDLDIDFLRIQNWANNL